LDTPFASPALQGLSLSIRESEITAIVGPTRAGKSTLIDMLAGLIPPQQGTFLFDGEETVSKSFDKSRLRREIGIVFQDPEQQIFEETVGLDVSFSARLRGLPLARSRQLVQDSLEAVGLDYEDFRSRYTYALSGGEKRRVALAGTLAMQPRVLILDEPTAGLDPRGRHDLHRLLLRLNKEQGLTIIYVSSSLEEVLTLADTIHVLDQGKHLLSGSPDEILRQARQLAAISLHLPEVTMLALALQEQFPALPTDLLTLDALEEALAKLLPTPSGVSEGDPAR
jgi:energy-coupling factor transport system ATP-binding protein